MGEKAINKTAKQLEIIKRKEIAIDLRTAGYSYRDIYSTMLELASRGQVVLPDSYDERYVYRDVKVVIEEANKNLVESAEMLRNMELHNLNRMQSAIIERAASGDLKAIDRVIAIMNQRGKYVPKLTEPQKIEVRGWQQEIIDLIKEGKITIDHIRELPPELGQEIMAQLPKPRSETGDGIRDDALEGEYVDLGQVDGEVPREIYSE
jgi:hypothetical protein